MIKLDSCLVMIRQRTSISHGGEQPNITHLSLMSYKGVEAAEVQVHLSMFEAIAPHTAC